MEWEDESRCLIPSMESGRDREEACAEFIGYSELRGGRRRAGMGFGLSSKQVKMNI